MKTSLLALGSALLLASCCTRPACVTHTDVATGATNPKAIYIRPFQIACTPFDTCTPSGDMLIRKSLAPVRFADNLQEELSKLAPARVLKPCEGAPVGWLVDGYFQKVESGYSPGCWSPLGPAVSRPSCVKMHVRVTDAVCKNVLYEFDMAAATKGEMWGKDYEPGMGYPLPFDFRNAAEQVMLVLTPDPFKYGARQSPVIRYY